VTVSFSNYLPWQAMHFLQRSTHFSKTRYRPFSASCRMIVEREIFFATSLSPSTPIADYCLHISNSTLPTHFQQFAITLISLIQSRPALGPTQPPIQWVPGVLYPGVNRPGREADHSPPSSTEVKNACSYTSAHSYAFMEWCLVK
jgi:hypothetical protein